MKALPSNCVLEPSLSPFEKATSTLKKASPYNLRAWSRQKILSDPLLSREENHSPLPASLPQAQRAPICQGSILLGDGTPFTAEVGLDVGLEGFISAAALGQEPLSLDAIPLPETAAYTALAYSEDSASLLPILTFKFAAPHKTYLHLGRPVLQSGFEIDLSL